MYPHHVVHFSQMQPSPLVTPLMTPVTPFTGQGSPWPRASDGRALATLLVAQCRRPGCPISGFRSDGENEVTKVGRVDDDSACLCRILRHFPIPGFPGHRDVWLLGNDVMMEVRDVMTPGMPEVRGAGVAVKQETLEAVQQCA